jgi:hypothetical protein
MLASALLNDGRIYDDTAETVAEIAAKIGLRRAAAGARIRAALAAGSLEKVWRRVGGIHIPAYRVKK